MEEEEGGREERSLGDEVVAALHCTLLHFLLKFSCIALKVYVHEEMQCENCSGVFEMEGLTEKALLAPIFSVTNQAALLAYIGAEGRKTCQIAKYAKQTAIFFNLGMH